MVKNEPLILVGVLVSSLSDMHSGLELPDLLGPGLAMLEYPLELKFDSDVVLLPHVVMTAVNGLRKWPPGFTG